MVAEGYGDGQFEGGCVPFSRGEQAAEVAVFHRDFVGIVLVSALAGP